MELIIKPTSACNFACTFCSAHKTSIKKVKRVPDQIVDVINTLKPDEIIITGGDPLCVDRQYYNHLLSITDCPIGLTTNLKGYYLNRQYWKPILSNPRVGVATSFQYGEQRRWDKDTPYTESMFVDVVTAFKDDFGYTPPFIAVITEDNIDRAIDHVLLAKKLETTVKLNGVIPVGASNQSVPLYKMVDIWDKVYQLGLQKYLTTYPQLTAGGCNFNTTHMCQSTIRATYVDDHDHLHYSFCETCLEGVNSCGPIEINRDVARPKQIAIYPTVDQLINKEQCPQCVLHDLCNGCKVTTIVAKRDKSFCDQMKSRIDKIVAHPDWAIDRSKCKPTRLT